jgi:hypothetical protein
MLHRRERLDRLYQIVSGDDDLDRTCEPIVESICTNLPRNYLLNAIRGAATKLSEQLASAKLIQPWILGALGTQTFLVDLLIPIRQAGTFLPR